MCHQTSVLYARKWCYIFRFGQMKTTEGDDVWMLIIVRYLHGASSTHHHRCSQREKKMVNEKHPNNKK